uniref:G-protein coupled receptors family 3 profile domain-containing protein n=2 Tax=Panagrolaimus sp. JU765 TaxID=591449 RepID=A0AC34QSB2_9BILA
MNTHYFLKITILLIFIDLICCANTRQRSRSTTENPNISSFLKLSGVPETFDELLKELEHTEFCNRTLSGKVINKLINDSFAAGKYSADVVFVLKVISEVTHIATARENPLNVTEMENSPITPPPIKPKEAIFGLQLICQENHPLHVSSHKHHLHPDAIWTPIAVYFVPIKKSYLMVRLPVIELDLCPMSPCQQSKCSWTIHGRAKVWGRSCCGKTNDNFCRDDRNILRQIILIISCFLAALSLAMIGFVWKARRGQQQESRGWALMELFFVGAAILYMIPTLDFVESGNYTCVINVWMREIGFTLFYGSIVLKIYRNLQEYRVRKAHHVIVREQDMLKYLSFLMTLTVLGLLAWTIGAFKNYLLFTSDWPQCPKESYFILWFVYELTFLLYGMRLCYKARSSHWTERNQFTVTVVVEAIILVVVTIIRYAFKDTGSRDFLLCVTAIQIITSITFNIIIIILPKYYTVTIQIITSITFNIIIIILPKYYTIGGDSNRRTLTMSGASNSGRAHPSLAKLRDNLINGTIDFAEIPIIDMNPEDIRAELKRVYTQLRMYKVKSLYQDNPHVSKRKAGKKQSDKTAKNRRISIPPTSSSPKIRRVDEEEEKSDLTVESAPHNVYLSTNKIQLDSVDQSVRV